MPPNVVLDTAFSCPTVDECLIGAQEGTVISGQLSVGRGVVANSEPQLLLTTTDGGTTWSEHNVPITPVLGNNAAFDPDLSGTWGQLTQLSCFDANTCDAFGLAPSDQEEEPVGHTGNTVTRNVFLQTTNGGITWSTYDFPWVANPDGSAGWSNWQVAVFSCASAQDCVGMSWVMTGNASQISTEFSWMTTDGGATWTRAWLPKIGDSLSNVRSISCPDAAHCVAVGAYGAAGTAWLSFIATTSDGGSTWTIETPSTNPGTYLLSVSCANNQECWAVGTANRDTSDVMITTSDAGASWVPVQVPALAGILDVVCLPAGSCYGIGTSALVGPETPSTEVITNESVGL